MTTRVIRNHYDIEMLTRFLRAQNLPVTVSITKGAKRSDEQNRLQHLLIAEIAAQKQDETIEEVRAFCKLCFGMPILREENEEFRAVYDERIKPLPYETKLKIIELFDVPVTRLMTTAQKTKYLDAIYQHFGAQGYVLTVPELAA